MRPSVALRVLRIAKTVDDPCSRADAAELIKTRPNNKKRTTKTYNE
jgi:hypothetical protein